jgi:CSLREA domain-containing protein
MPRHHLLAATISQLLILQAAHALAPTSASTSPSTKTTGPGQVQGGADFVVNAADDAGNGSCGAAAGECTLRDAVLAAESNADASVITFDPTVFASPATISLTNGELAMKFSTTISGPGANRLTIDAGGLSRIFHFADTASPNTALNTVNIVSGLTLSGGNGNGNTPDPGGRGGAIRSVAPLELDQLHLVGNQAAADGGAVWSRFRDLTLTDSTLSGNTAAFKGGGAYVRQNSVTVINSTISGNGVTAGSGNGGAIYSNGSPLSLANCTITGNTSNVSAVGTTNTVTLLGTIVANSSGPDLKGTFNAYDSLIEAPGTATFNMQSNTLLSVAPRLGELGDHGGTTPTHLPLPGSPAIDHFSGCSGQDQRGESRPFGAACDIGAVEVQEAGQTGPDFVVNASDDLGDGFCGTATGECTLRDAVIAANSDPTASVITFDASVFASAQTTMLTMGQMVVSSPVSIVGPGQSLLTLDANTASRHFLIDDGDNGSNLDVALSGLTLTHGHVSGAESGGALNNRENLTIDAMSFNSNSANNTGGAIFSAAPGTSVFSIDNSSLSGNQAAQTSAGAEIQAGSGSFVNIAATLFESNTAGNGTSSKGGGLSLLLNDTTLDLHDSTFATNRLLCSDCRGAGLYIAANAGVTQLARLQVLGNIGADVPSGPSSSARGGGLFLSQTTGSATISESTFSGNRAAGDPGGLSTNTRGGGAFIAADQSSVTLSRSTVSGNSSYQRSGGLYLEASNNADLAVLDSTVSGNSSLLVGGGVYASVDGSSTVSVEGSSIVDNQAGTSSSSSATHGGGLASIGAGSLNVAAVVLARNTDLSSNPAPDILPQSAGSAISNSLIGDNSGSGLTGAPVGSPDGNNNLIGDPFGAGVIDARLGPLANNGGPTLTHYPFADSPLIDHFNGCSGIDQIGSARGVEVNGDPGQACDIGAVESAGDLVFADGFDPSVVLVAYEKHVAQLSRVQIEARLRSAGQNNPVQILRAASVTGSDVLLVVNARQNGADIELQLNRYLQGEWLQGSWRVISAGDVILRW